MPIEVRATRMDLLQLRKRIGLARRGHKLLKDKLDELMRQFKILIARYEGAREILENELESAYREFLFARAEMEEAGLLDALRYPGAEARISTTTRKIMNLTLPVFEVTIEGNVRNYGMFDTPAELDESLEIYRKVLPKIVELAEQEKAISLIAGEIDTTRRRVNSLEFILIPDLEQAIRYIRLKLDEMERGNLTRLMKVNAMVEEKREAARGLVEAYR